MSFLFLYSSLFKLSANYADTRFADFYFTQKQAFGTYTKRAVTRLDKKFNIQYNFLQIRIKSLKGGLNMLFSELAGTPLSVISPKDARAVLQPPCLLITQITTAAIPMSIIMP